MSKSKISKSESIHEFEESIKNMSEQDKNRVDSRMDKMEKLRQASIMSYEEYDLVTPIFSVDIYRDGFIAGATSPAAEQYWNGWVSEKPDFKEECVFITATKYTRNYEPLPYDYKIWQIKMLLGENDKGESAWYLGLLDGDGEEWGDLEDLQSDLYKIISSPPKTDK